MQRKRAAFYTTRIIYKFENPCYSAFDKKSDPRTGSGKEKDMAAMNRLYELHIESHEALRNEQYEQGYSCMRSFEVWHRRENCAFEVGWHSET
jgi:hypothetical protein